MQIYYTEKAVTDLERGLLWYAQISPALANDFLVAIEEKVQLILLNPASYKRAHKIFRVAILSRFPFSIFYTLEDDAIVVHAVFDNRQHPQKKP